MKRTIPGAAMASALVAGAPALASNKTLNGANLIDGSVTAPKLANGTRCPVRTSSTGPSPAPTSPTAR
jgi:hypothetical protein